MPASKNPTRRSIVLALLAGCVVVAVWLYARHDTGGPAAAVAPTEAPGQTSAEAPAQGGAIDRLLVAAGRPRRPLSGDETVAIVEGTARDASTHAGIAGAEVVFAAPGGRRELTTTTGSDGRYRLELPHGAWMVRAFGDRIVSMPVSVRIGPDSGPVDLELIRAGRIRGVVRTAEGRAVAGADVSLVHARRELTDALESTIGRTAVTDGSGTFTLDVLPGTVELVAVSGTLTGAAKAGPVVSDTESTVTILMRAQLVVTGRVIDAAGAPVAGATVIALAQFFDHGGRNRRTVTTAADGRFVLDGIDAATLILDAHSSAGAAAPVLRLELAASPPPPEIVLQLAAGAHLFGRVVAADGAALADAKITVTRHGTSWPFATTHADRAGQFDVPAPPGEHFQVVASTDDGVARLPAAVPGEELHLVIGAKGGIRGLARRGEQPFAGDLRVMIYRYVPAGSTSAWPRLIQQQVATRDGRFEVPDLDPGSYDLEIGVVGATPLDIKGVVVPAGGWADLPVALGAGAP